MNLNALNTAANLEAIKTAVPTLEKLIVVTHFQTVFDVSIYHSNIQYATTQCDAFNRKPSLSFEIARACQTIKQDSHADTVSPHFFNIKTCSRQRSTVTTTNVCRIHGTRNICALLIHLTHSLNTIKQCLV